MIITGVIIVTNSIQFADEVPNFLNDGMVREPERALGHNLRAGPPIFLVSIALS